MEVDPAGFGARKDAMDGAEVQVEEAQRTLVAALALKRRLVEHLIQVEDVSIEVDGVHPVGLPNRDALQRHIAPEVHHHDALDLFEPRPDPLLGTVPLPRVNHLCVSCTSAPPVVLAGGRWAEARPSV